MDAEEEEIILVVDEEEAPAVSGGLSIAPLSAEEARVLGCLMEKEATTPDQYPLSLNSLVTACNQSTARDPVVSYDEGTVQAALEVLKARQFVLQVTLAGARVQKYKHLLATKLPDLQRPQFALLCVLLLRGAQTVGELRTRSERLYAFSDLAATEACLGSLAAYREGSLVVSFPPGSGRKATLFMHTLCGSPELPSGSTDAVSRVVVQSQNSVISSAEDQAWRASVDAELKTLREELASLKAALGM